MSAWLGGVEGSGWLRHVRSVLESGVLVAKELAAGVSVLVHCSDGWDRTAQTCALAQIMLDPHYRTIHGFQVRHIYLEICGSCDVYVYSPINLIYNLNLKKY